MSRVPRTRLPRLSSRLVAGVRKQDIVCRLWTRQALLSFAAGCTDRATSGFDRRPCTPIACGNPLSYRAVGRAANESLPLRRFRWLRKDRTVSGPRPNIHRWADICQRHLASGVALTWMRERMSSSRSDRRYSDRQSAVVWRPPPCFIDRTDTSHRHWLVWIAGNGALRLLTPARGEGRALHHALCPSGRKHNGRAKSDGSVIVALPDGESGRESHVQNA